MNWPALSDYNDAIQNPRNCFQDADLRAGRIALTRLGLPRVASGNFASVYEISNGVRRWAVRCFSRRPISDQQNRYSLLSQYLAGLSLPVLVQFEYVQEGIRVRGQWYPIVKMEWVEGKALHVHIEENLNNPQALGTLAARWHGLVNDLRDNRLAHGDLQHGNALVASQGIRLVDYDAMFTPALSGKLSPELGHPNYQHPGRQERHYDETLDNFSALVIYTSLRALAAEPSLWQEFHLRVDDGLIFSKADYEKPRQSEALRRLKQSADPDVRALAETLERCCLGSVAQVQDFVVLLGSLSSTQPVAASTAPSPTFAPTSAPPSQAQTSPWWQTTPPRPATASAGGYTTTRLEQPQPSPTPPQRIPDRITARDGAEMVLIPAGEFQMGSNDGSSDEKPVHTVYVDAFYMDKYEVTNAQFKTFINTNPQWSENRIPREYHSGNYLSHWNGNDYPVGKGDHPVVYVSWYAAMAYAQWAGKRLPIEAEWEKAARGGLVGKRYPWGDEIDASKANYNRNVGGTTPVGKYPANGYGLYDMAGNVWEWCLDEYDSGFYAKSPKQNPIAGGSISGVIYNFTNVKSARVLRGGSWDYNPSLLRVANRYYFQPTNAHLSVGFRCAGLGSVSP